MGSPTPARAASSSSDSGARGLPARACQAARSSVRVAGTPGRLPDVLIAGRARADLRSMAATLAVPRPGPGLRLAFRRLGSILVFGVLPAAALVAVLWSAGHGLAFDFRHDLWEAGRRILDGR